MNRRINIQDAHAHALRGISEHADIGRIPFYDYTIEYQRFIGGDAPKSPNDLIHFLATAESISQSEPALEHIKTVYKKYSLEIPMGLLDLPVWWAPTILESIEEVNWVEPDIEQTQEIFGWDFVSVQAAYLDIQFPRVIDHKPEVWSQIGQALMKLHQRFEPGPFTPLGRLVEFV